MIVELKPAQQRLLDRAAQAGMNPAEVLDQAFAVIGEQYRNEDWMVEEREAVSTQIEEGFAQAQRGELMTPEEAARELRERREKRRIA